MRHSSSPSTPPSSASRSPYASFFDLQSVFQCGCTSDVDFPAEHDEAQKRVSELRKPQQDSIVEHDDDDELHMIESAKDYMDRISKQLANMEDRKRTGAWKIPQQSTSAPASLSKNNENDQAKSDTVFRISDSSSSSTSNSTRRFHSLKHTESESTQSTSGLTDDEFSITSTAENHGEESIAQAKPVIVSILRRKEKMGAVEIASKGTSVTFCPTTVFPDPNEVPKKRKRVRRIAKAQAKFESYESQVELRRLERRAQQRQHPYITNDLRSPSSDFLQQTESFYVFR